MSRKIRLALSAGALVVVVALAWFFLISPLRGEIAKTDQAIATESTRLAAAQAKLAKAEVTRAEGKKNQALLMELAKMVPETSQVPSLLVQIQDIADQSGIKFESVTPGDPTEQDGYQIVPLTLQFTGTYFDLSDFAYRAEQLVAGPGRLLTLKSIQLALGGTSDGTGSAKAKTSSPELKVSMTLYAFCMDQDEAGQTIASAPGSSTSGTASTAAADTGTTSTTTAK
jgi:Tfp pilus assembly protein PilO